jgi:hypothetical protein
VKATPDSGKEVLETLKYDLVELSQQSQNKRDFMERSMI